MALVTRHAGGTEWAADAGCTLWTRDRRLAHHFDGDAALELVDTLVAGEAARTFAFGVSFEALDP